MLKYKTARIKNKLNYNIPNINGRLNYCNYSKQHRMSITFRNEGCCG